MALTVWLKGTQRTNFNQENHPLSSIIIHPFLFHCLLMEIKAEFHLCQLLANTCIILHYYNSIIAIIIIISIIISLVITFYHRQALIPICVVFRRSTSLCCEITDTRLVPWLCFHLYSLCLPTMAWPGWVNPGGWLARTASQCPRDYILPLWFFFLFSMANLWGQWMDLKQTQTHIHLWLLYLKNMDHPQAFTP